MCVLFSIYYKYYFSQVFNDPQRGNSGVKLKKYQICINSKLLCPFYPVSEIVLCSKSKTEIAGSARGERDRGGERQTERERAREAVKERDEEKNTVTERMLKSFREKALLLLNI